MRRCLHGTFDEAEELAREAVALAEETDMISWQGDLRINLAEVLRLAGRPRQYLL